jgi:two-component sensor histidine kinase
MGATDVEERLAFELAGSPEATAAARRLLLAGNGALPGNVRDDVLLLVTELVTNAVRHADAVPDPTLRVEFRHWSRTVRVAVCDEGPGFVTAAADWRRREGRLGAVTRRSHRRLLGDHAHRDWHVRVVRDPLRRVTRGLTDRFLVPGRGRIQRRRHSRPTARESRSTSVGQQKLFSEGGRDE